MPRRESLTAQLDAQMTMSIGGASRQETIDGTGHVSQHCSDSFYTGYVYTTLVNGLRTERSQTLTRQAEFLGPIIDHNHTYYVYYIIHDSKLFERRRVYCTSRASLQKKSHIVAVDKISHDNAIKERATMGRKLRKSTNCACMSPCG